MLLLDNQLAQGKSHISAGEENSVKFAEIDRAMASALEQVPCRR